MKSEIVIKNCAKNTVNYNTYKNKCSLSMLYKYDLKLNVIC